MPELTAAELRAAVTNHGLSVLDRRVKEQLVSALERTRKVPIAEILGALPLPRLKDLCRTLAIDDSGRRKRDVVARLTRRAQPAKKRPRAARKAPRDSVERAIPHPKTLSVDELEKHLWAAADILRGSIDSSDYKTYIFGLLFLKRLSDRFEEEAEKLIAEGEPEKAAWGDRDNHQFFVPDRARWDAILKTATNIGECLNKACAALEEENAGLEGVLAGIDYNDEHRLGDGRQRDNVLARLVQHFSQISLRNDSMAEPDLLGRAYEYLIEQFADDAGKKGGEFYTPRMDERPPSGIEASPRTRLRRSLGCTVGNRRPAAKRCRQADHARAENGPAMQLSRCLLQRSYHRQYGIHGSHRYRERDQ